MKFLHLIGTLNPSYGGPVEGVRQLLEAQNETGDSMEVATLDSQDAPWLADFPAKVFALGPAYLKYRYAPRLFVWLQQNADRYDGILVNGIWQYQSYAAWRALRASDVPYFVYIHGALDPWFKARYPVKHLKKWLYWPWAEYRVLRDAKAVIFTTEAERLSARESFWLYRCNEAVISYGTQAPVGDADVQRRGFLEAYPGLQGKRVLLFLSRIHPKKACDLVIQAFARVLGGNPDWHLVIAGPDQLGGRKVLEELATTLGIGQQVTWTGMLTGQKKWGAYRAADAFILPSHSENFGIVVAEALACRLPVLISDKVNIWREVVNSNAGIAGADDLDGTVELVTEWVQMPQPQRDAMRLNAERCFLEHFEIRNSANNLSRYLSRALTSS